MKRGPLVILITGVVSGCFLIVLVAFTFQVNSLDHNWLTTASQTGKAINITPDGQTVLVINPDSHSLTFIDTATQAFIAEIPVGLTPQQVAVSVDNSFAYVTNKGTDSISVVDLQSRTVVREIPVGAQPVGIALSPDKRFIVVSETGQDTLHFISTVTYQSLSRVAVFDRPYAVVFMPDGKHVLASHLLSGNVSVLPVQPFSTFLPTTYFQHPQSHEIIAQTGFDPDDPVNHANVIIPTWPHVAPAPAIIINATGTRAYLPQSMANGQGLNTQFDNTVFPKVSVLNLETWTHQSSEHISLPETDRPVGLPWQVALARGDTELWVVNAASNDVSVIDISNPTIPIRQAHILVGQNPRGVVISPDGQQVYINNTLDGTVSVINATTYTVTKVITVTDIPLPPILLNGKQLFHSSARPELSRAAWISCNTCHIEGEQDGRTWLLQYLGDVPPGVTPVITRNTTSLLGMVETYPLRWSAEWDESADSEFSIRFEQFGTGLIEGDMHPPLGLPNQGRSAELDALAAYIDSLPLPGREQSLTAAAQRGKSIFESPLTGCLTCHPPPLYTDLQQHDVGTADKPGEWLGPYIDTPTLRFLSDSSPYLHDGSINTLVELFTLANPEDKHGQTNHLTTAAIQDLVAFLLLLPYEQR